jgi:hypothetical protein
MHDFDFLFGTWHVHNARLVERLVGSTVWEEFVALHQCRPMLGGRCNVDEMVTSWRGGFRGMSVRLYDGELWNIYWASTMGGVLDPPVEGSFVDGVGTFYGRDQHQGTPVRVRYLWSAITPTTARWEQAFSTDDGKTWETNWRMQFTRVTT